MRVHGTVQQKSGGKQYGMAAAAAIIALIVFNAVRGADNNQAATAATEPTSKSVFVAKMNIDQGSMITTEMVNQETRPISTLPEDVVTNFDQLTGKTTSGLIPAGYPIALSLMTGNEEAEVKESDEKTEPDVPVTAIAPSHTVGVTLTFATSAPRKDSRVALSIQNGQGRPALVADEAWVESSQGKTAQIRVTPEKALFLEEARQLGTLSYFEIGATGPSPFAGSAIDDISALRERFDNTPKRILSKGANAVKQTVTQALSPSSFSSFAWSRDKTIKYGIDKDGKIYVIERNGTVTPLHEYYIGADLPELPPSIVDSTAPNGVPEESSNNSGEVRSGLEPLMSLMSHGGEQ